MRVTNGIVAAFVAVLLCNSHYHHDGVGMVAAAAVSGGGEEETDTTTRGTTMTTVVDGVPAEPTRKLIKRSKASKPDADDEVDTERLLRFLVFTTAMDVYSSMQSSSSLEEGVLPRAGNDNGGRELETVGENYDEHACDGCVAFYKFMTESRYVDPFLRQQFCELVAGLIPGNRKQQEKYLDICFDLLHCNEWNGGTATECCLYQGVCKNSGYYCKLNCNSGSCENYWIQTNTQAECNTESTAIGCGDCKNQVDSTAILEKAGMPKDGFVSHCVGGPCVWTLQRTQCIGLTKYPALTTAKACKDACCDDYTCAVWQFDADGHRDQCWYGKNCDELGEFLAWTYGGIRSMGTDQAPDCVRP